VITQPALDQWRSQVPWETPDVVEQDLVLSRLIVEIANHPLLGDELIFRGGTCFHKVWLDRPWRYSEDLDYVRRTGGGVGPILDALREVADAVGFDREELVATKIRALYQRRKGRDLFDMWLAVEEANLAPEAIAEAYGPYRPDGWTHELALENLAAKLEDTRFTSDLDTLVAVWPERYTVEAGAEIARAVIAAIAP